MKHHHTKRPICLYGSRLHAAAVIATLERHGGHNAHHLAGDDEGFLYFISPTTGVIEHTGHYDVQSVVKEFCRVVSPLADVPDMYIVVHDGKVARRIVDSLDEAMRCRQMILASRPTAQVDIYPLKSRPKK